MNRAFEPEAVVYNNPDWDAASRSELVAKRQHFVVGAVDTRRFFPGRRGSSDKIVVVSQARKQIELLLDALRRSDDDVVFRLFGSTARSDEIDRALEAGRLELFGPTDPAHLPALYRSSDMAVHVEQFAGWANVAAEAM
ncbi:MAG: hypothetical protein AAF658_19155, partial [Myxococcota bacterium]